MTLPAQMATLVKARANDRCEYCQMSQFLQGATFHFDHIKPLTCGGSTTPENLALACPSCNLHKSDRSHAVDPETGLSYRLYQPRTQIWSDHFVWEETKLIARSPIGRATITALELNHPRRLRVRAAEALFDLFPPPRI